MPEVARSFPYWRFRKVRCRLTDRACALDARTAVGAAVLLEESLNPPLQLPVLRRAGTLGALSPSVVAGPRDAVYRTEPRHRVIAPVRVDEREDVSFRVAQNRMAFFRRACSSCSSACAR